MKVEKNVIDSLNAKLTLTIEKEDYLPLYKQKMNSHQQKSHMKGFRKGKTPMSMIEKMYGTATLQETISKLLTDKINDIIKGDEFNIIGEPLLVNEDKLAELLHTDMQDYVYEFEIGMEPELEVKGVSEKDSYTKKVVKIDDDIIKEELKAARKRLGESTEVDGPPEEEDIIHFDLKEMEGKNIKVGGHESHTSVPLDRINKKYRKELKSAKKGDDIDVDIYELEKNATKDYVNRYFLKLEEGKTAEDISGKFRAKLTKIQRIEPAELNQDFFDKYFGPDQVKSEEEAREKIREYSSDYFNQEAVNLLNREVMESLMEKNKVPLPEEFLQKWLSRDKEYTDEQFDSFKKELKWRIIKKKLTSRFGVKVNEEEIFKYFVNTVRNYSPYIDEASLKNTVFSLMQNKEQLNSAIENISSGKLFDAIREVIQIKEKKISRDEFYDIVKSINQKAK